MMIKPGDRFTRLTVIKRGPNWIGPSGGKHRLRYVCRCDCGAKTLSMDNGLRSGSTKSCGCLRRETAVKNMFTGREDHVLSIPTTAPEYTVWRAMRARCHNPKTKGYEHWGGRGITVCDRWRFGTKHKTGFECFIKDMGRRPHPELSIDRIDNDGNYEKKNCRWATRSEQNLNKRKRSPRSRRVVAVVDVPI